MEINKMYGTNGMMKEYHYATQVPAGVLAAEDAAATGGYGTGNILTQQEGGSITPGVMGNSYAGYATNPNTGNYIDPATGYDINPQTGYDIDPQTGLDINPATGQDFAPGGYAAPAAASPMAGYAIDPNTGYYIDPATGLDINPQTGQDIPASIGYPQQGGGYYPPSQPGYAPAPAGYPAGYYPPSQPGYAPTPAPGTGGTYYQPQPGYPQPAPYGSAPVSSAPVSSAPASSMPSTAAPTIDMTGTWQSQQNGSYQPSCNAALLSFLGNSTMNVPYETTAAGTITFMTNPGIIAGQPAGAVTGTLSGLNANGQAQIGSTITWNDVHGDTWTRIA